MQNINETSKNDSTDMCALVDMSKDEGELGIRSNVCPLQLTYINETDEIKKVSVFEIFNVNEKGLKLIITNGDNPVSMEFLKKYFYEKPHLSSFIRLMCSGLKSLQIEKGFYCVRKNPMGQSVKYPAFLPLNYFSKNQFQSEIVDIPYPFILDGLSYDLEFDLMPNKTLTLTMFFRMACSVRNVESLKRLKEERALYYDKQINYNSQHSFVIENNSDVPKEITLLDVDKMHEYSLDKDLKIYRGFNNDIIDSCSKMKYYFNFIRIYAKSESDENNLKQISKSIEFNNGNKYYPAINVDGNQFQSELNDIDTNGEYLSCENPMRVTVMPKTRVVYLFGRKDKINDLGKSFINIDIENISEVCKKQYDILSVNKDDKAILHSVDKNNMSFSDGYTNANAIRIQFYNKEQIEKPILLKIKDDKHILYPICYYNESSFYANVIEVKLPIEEKFCLKDLEILVDLSNKGDGMNVLLFNWEKGFAEIEKPISKHGQNSFMKTLGLNKWLNKSFPIWIENTTDETKIVELVNDISEYKGFPDGVKCNSDLSASYEEVLKAICNNGLSNTNLSLLKLYSKSVPQITSVINIIDYTDTENIITSELICQSYFSANQFQANAVPLPICKIFDLTRVLSGDGNEVSEERKIAKKQKINFRLLAKTKLCLILEQCNNNNLVIK